MKLTRQRMIQIVWVIILALVLSACFVFSSRKHILHLGVFAGSNWDVPGTSVYEIVDDVIDRFEKSHPGVEVVYESGIRKDDYSEWLAGKLLEGELPDVFMVLDQDFSSLARLGALKNLSPMDFVLDQEVFYPTALAAGQWEGTQYALPYESNPQFMFVNLTLLENEGIQKPEAGWTLGDLYAISKQVTKDLDGDGHLDQFGIYNYSWQDAMEAYGKSPFSSNGREANLLDEDVQHAIEYAYQLNGLADQETISQNDFDKGRVAFSPMSYAEYRTYKPYPWRVKKFSEFEWTIIPMPGFIEGSSSAHADSLLMSMSSRTTHVQEAWDLMTLFACDEKTQLMISEKSQGLPSLASIQAQESSIAELDGSIVDQVMQESRAPSRFPGYDTLMLLLDTQIRSQYEDAADKDIFFIDLQQYMTQAIEQTQQ